MNNYIKAILVFVLAVAIYGGYVYPKATSVFGSQTGSTFNDAKVAAVVMAPSTPSATSTSIKNTDGSARWITDAFVYCSGNTTAFTNITGAGLAALTLQAATTSVANEGLQGSTSYSVNMTLATSSTFVSNASSTPAVFAGNWAAGSNLTFLFNATTTASAACTVGVHYLGS